MKLPHVVKEIRSRYLARFAVPVGTPETIDVQARTWSLRFAQQVAFELPGQGWGMKRADPGRPIGKDTIANRTGGLKCWDLLMGTGTGAPVLVDDPESQDISDQVFVEVEPFNWLGTVRLPPTLPPDVSQLEGKLDGLTNLVIHLENLVKATDDNNERRYQDLVARLSAVSAVKGFTGAARIPYLGTAPIDLVPKP